MRRTWEGRLATGAAALLTSALLSAIGVSVPAGPAYATPGTCQTGIATFAHTGGEQCYVVPAGVTILDVTAVGDPGGSTGGANGYAPATYGKGGKGAVVSAHLDVPALALTGRTLYLEVGSGGSGAPNQVHYGASEGGNSTDIRTCSVSATCSTDPRIVVAGGGGGASIGNGGFAAADGGDAGGASPAAAAPGTDGTFPGSPGADGTGGGTGGGGGGSTAPGAGGIGGNCTAGAGLAGHGSAGGLGGYTGPNGCDGFNGYQSGGSGGGGYFGGGGGGDGARPSGGGGGSSYASPTGTTNALFGLDTSGTPEVVIGGSTAALTVTSPAGSALTCSTEVDGGASPSWSASGPCANTQLQGSTVQLTATPPTGEVAAWTGCDSVGAGSATCQVTMNAARGVSLSFVPTHTLTVAANPASTGSGVITGTIPGSSIYCGGTRPVCSEPVAAQNGQPGTETLSAVPATGSYFAGWTNCSASDSPADQLCTVSVDHDLTVYASFQTCPVADCSPVPLTVGADPASTGAGQIAGPDGGIDGAIACNPAPTDLRSPPAGCVRQYPYGAVVTLTATPIGTTDVSSILGWSVPGCGARTVTCTVTVTRDQAGHALVSTGGTNAPVQAPVLVKFGLGAYTLHLAVAGNGTLTVDSGGATSSCSASCDQSYPANSTLVISGYPDLGHTFGGWGSSCPAGTGNPYSGVSATGVHQCHLTVNGPVNTLEVDANFATDNHSITVDPAGPGAGTITSTGGAPAPVNCSTDLTAAGQACAAFFPYGTAVTLTAHPAAGSGFGSWSHCDSQPSATTCVLNIGTSDLLEKGTFYPVPAVTGVSPDRGTNLQAPVTITGTGFNGADAVSFGSARVTTTPCPATYAGPCFTVGSDSSITAYPPPAPGPLNQVVDVTVTNPGGTSRTGTADRYSYTDLPPDVTPTTTVAAPDLFTKDFSYTATLGGQQVHILVPAKSLPAGTTFYVYSSSASEELASQLPANAQLFGSFGLSWLTPDGKTPDPDPRHPIVFTVSVPAPAGARPFQSLGASTSALEPLGVTVFLPGNVIYDPAKGTFTGSYQGASHVINAGNLIEVPDGNLITAGGGNLITAGGGNLITAGGGNLVSVDPTGGNFVIPTATGLFVHGSGIAYSSAAGFAPSRFSGANGFITAGGGNLAISAVAGLTGSSLALFSADYSDLVSRAASLITAGGGNFITAGGGNVIFMNSSQLLALSASSGVVAGISRGDPLFLFAATPPFAPSGVTATARAGTVHVQWLAPSDGGSALTSYTVTVQPGGRSVTVAAPGPLSADVAGLAPGNYTATVTATNAHGTSPASAPVGFTVPAQGGWGVTPTGPAPVPVPAGTGPSGGPSDYHLVGRDGGVFSFGDAGFYGSAAGMRLNSPVVGMATTPGGGGYWLGASDGGVFSFGDAGFYGSAAGMRLNSPVVGMATPPGGGGYWLGASDGGVFSFGDAGFYGSAAGMRLNSPVVGMATTPGGGGYWLVASDGGVFSFGGARFFGSAAGSHLASPVVAMAPTADGLGYWLVTASGQVLAFGDASSHGDPGTLPLGARIVGLRPSPDGLGYWVFGADGGVFAYGDAAFDGSLGGRRLAAPIVAGA